MQDISLEVLLEAGCHFGHKSERWHPKAAQFIYTEKDGIHIIDLAKTKAGLEAAGKFIEELVAGGSEVLFVATKRQAKGVVKEIVEKAGAPYLVERWIGGFLTNWEQVQKNIAKINRLTEEASAGTWKKFPKHEQLKLSRYLARLHTFYSGVLALKTPPAALFVVDVKKEISAVREGLRIGIPIVAIVDTNTDPENIAYPIPANDDAVGSIALITQVIAGAYLAGKILHLKKTQEENLAQVKTEPKAIITEVANKEVAMQAAAEAPKKKRGRPRKLT